MVISDKSEETVLLVDDDPVNLSLLRIFLQREGFRALTADSAKGALEMVQQEIIDIILLDIMMPEMDGYELCQQFKADPETTSIPVIFISVLEDSDAIARGFEVGAVDYLRKPAHPSEVSARINIHLALRRTQKQLEEEIRQRIQVEEALRVSELRYRTIFHNSMNAIALHQLVIDDGKPVDYIFLEVNSAFEAFTGFSAEQVIGKRVTEVFDGEDMSFFIDTYGKVVLTGEPCGFVQYVPSLGRYYDISAFVAEPGQFVTFFHDITARKQGEIERIRLWTAVEQSSSSIVITDVDGNIEYVNPKFCAVTGYTFDEAIGQNPRILRSGKQPNEFYAELWQTISSGESWIGEFCNKRKDGSLFWEKASISPVFDDTGTITHYLALKDDITERRELEAEALRAKRLEVDLMKERELTAFREQLVSTLSHEFRTPLTVIQTAIGMLEAYFDRLDPERRNRLLRQISEAVEQNIMILDKTLALRRADADKIDFAPIIIDLNAYCESAVKKMQFADASEHVLEYRGSQVVKAAVDVELLRHILENLISNALKYTAEGGAVTVSLMPDAVGQYVILRVEDEGIGIPDADLDKIFDAYHRGGNVGRIRGTGLGLSIVKSYVELHGGRITCESRMGQGTIFSVYLPTGVSKHMTVNA